MKKVFALLAALGLFFQSFAAITITEPRKKASELFIPVGVEGKKVSLMELSTLSVKEMESLNGKKMRLAEKVGFKISQYKLKQSIAKDGTIKNKRLSKAFDENGGFHIGGFALGFLLGLIGVLIAYLIKDDRQSSRRKWAWIGWGIGVVLALLFLL